MQIAIHPVLSAAGSYFQSEFEQAASYEHLSVELIRVTRVPYRLPAVDTAGPVAELPVHVGDDEALIGPLHIPGVSVCPNCLEHWLDNNLFDKGPPDGPIDETHLSLVARRVRQFLQDERRTLLSAAISVRLADGHLAHHPVFPLRDCARCSNLPPSTGILEAHCSRWTGIVGQMECSSEMSAGAFRCTAVWTPPVPVATARPHLLRQHSHGRGRTSAEAAVGCAGEAAERYSIVYRGDESFTRARLGDIEDLPAIHPNEILLYSNRQYAERERWNATSWEEMWVPEPFDEAIPADWIRCQRVSRASEWALVPAACCLMWYHFPAGEPEFARADTIGCAAGETRAMALRGALLEWIERDALAIWWDNRLHRPAVVLQSVQSEGLLEVMRGLSAIGRRLTLLDCTTDLGIPAFVAVAARDDGSEPLIGAAADPSPRRAAYRAASEAGQVWYEARRTGALPESMREWLTIETTTTQPYLAPAGWTEAAPEPSERDVCCEAIVDRLENLGLAVYSVDHSRADVAVPTVRAIVPGLRHIWNRRAPGRLYDVPVRMGWRSHAIGEHDLNPIRCMI